MGFGFFLYFWYTYIFEYDNKMNIMKNVFLYGLCCICLLPVMVVAQNFNPIIPDCIADPSVCKFGDTYYLYATADRDSGLDRAGTPAVWKSKDFVNWSFEGSLISGIDWAKAYPIKDEKCNMKEGYFRFWAPGKVIKKGSHYLLYVTFVKPNQHKGTYVLMADKPDGPFHFIEGDGLLVAGEKGLETVPIAPDIDGEPFIDGNGKGFLFWRKRMAARLTGDYLHFDGIPQEMKTHRNGYSEGPIMFKREGIYYYLYTLSANQNYVYAYMMSKKGPLSGFETPKGNDIFLFSSIRNNVWGPGHGNVFYDKSSNKYIFVYLEYGDGGTTRQVYADKMEFNKDGTIKTLIPNGKGVGYLGQNQEMKMNISGQAHFSASSIHSPRTTTVKIETQPNAPLENGASVEAVTRTHNYYPKNVADRSNGTCWHAAKNDKNPWLIADMNEVKAIDECQFFFTQPTEGQSWCLEKSINGKVWKICGKQKILIARSPHIAKNIGKVRYLRLSIDSGDAGVWEWRIYQK